MKEVITYLLFLLIITPSVLALPSTTNIQMGWKFDNPINLADVRGSANWTQNNSVQFLSSGNCKYGECAEAGTAGDYLNITPVGGNVPDNQTFSFSGWFYPTIDTSAANVAFFSVDQQSGLNIFNLGLYQNALYTIWSTNLAPNQECFGTLPVSLNTWHHFAITKNLTNHVVHYVDGVAESACAVSGETLKQPSNGYTTLFTNSFVQFYTGRADSIYLFNKVLDLADVQSIYNSGVDFEFGPDTINITAKSPANGTLLSVTDMTINVSISSGTNYNATLSFNGVINQTLINISLSTAFLQFNVTIPNGTEMTVFSYEVNVSNEDSVHDTTNTTYFRIDNIQPDITWNYPSFFNTTTTTANNATLNITIDDPGLFSWYWNATRVNGSLFFHREDVNVSYTTVALNESINITGYDQPVSIYAKACDGHTSKEIRQWRNAISLSRMDFNDGEVSILPWDAMKLNRADSRKQNDRYVFEYETKIPEKTQEYVITSTSPIIVIGAGSKYPGHLVMGNKWVDFDTVDLKNVVVEIIDPYTVKVTVEKKSPTRVWNYNSIGELNCVTHTVILNIDHAVPEEPESGFVTGFSVLRETSESVAPAIISVIIVMSVLGGIALSSLKTTGVATGLQDRFGVVAYYAVAFTLIGLALFAILTLI